MSAPGQTAESLAAALQRERSALSLLKATLESTADGILVVDTRGRTVSWNRKFVEMWRIPEEIVLSRDDERALAYVVDQLSDGDAFLGRVRYLYEHPEEESLDLLGFKDGRVFERSSKPQRVGGVPVGRVWSFRDVTERLKAEEALRDSERRYRDLFNLAPVGIYQASHEGRLLTVNAALARLLEYANPRELLELRTLDAIYSEREDRDRALTRSGPVGVGRSIDVRLTRKDGTGLWAQVNTHRVTDAEGRTLYVEGFVTDLTERKRGEQVQSVRFAATRALADAWTFDDAADGLVRGLCRELGLSAGVFWRPDTRGDGLVPAAEWHDARDERFAALGAASRAAHLGPGVELPGRVFSTGAVLLHEPPDGGPTPRRGALLAAGPLSGCAFPVISDGEVLGVVELLGDVSARLAPEILPLLSEIGGPIGQFVKRKEVETSQRELEERWRILFERNLAGVYRSTASGRLLECNDAFARIFGYPSRAELLAAGSVLGFYADAAEREAFLARLRREGAVTSVETRCQRRDGTPIWVLENVSYRAAGADEGILEGTMIDVTDRKRLESEVRQAQKMEAIGRLAGGIAHDFNNLLTAILGFSELALADVEPGSPLEATLSEIKRAGDRAAELTRQLLAFGRRQMLAPVVLDLNDAVRGMEKMLQRLIGADVQVRVELAPRIGHVRADPAQIEQVVLNLVVNARDAMPDGGALVVATRAARLDAAAAGELALAAGDYAVLSVSDTGHGMDAETRSHLFEPFFTTKERGRGTGLGLPTVYGIVKQSGGGISVTTAPGVGSTFDVYLPRVEEEEPRPLRPSGTLRVLSGSETILLVENEDAVRAFVRSALERAGYRVLEARHGVEALEMLETYGAAVRLVVTDVVMPVMGGRDLGRRLGASQPLLPVLYISGFADEALLGEAGSGHALLAKPFTKKDLLRRVRDLLGGAAQP